MRNIFLERSYTKCGGEASPAHFSGKLKLRISLDQWSKVLCSLFLLYPKLRAIKYIETKLQTTCFYLILSIFKKKVWNQSPRLIFCINFEEKHFSCYSLLIDQVSLSGCFQVLRYWAICVLQLFLKINLLFLIKPFFLHDLKVMIKT